MSRLRVIGAAVSLVFVVTACGVPSDPKPRNIPNNQVPFDLLAPSTTESPTTAPVVTTTTQIYLLNGEKLKRVARSVASPVSLGTVLASLIQGPTPTETSSGLRSEVDPLTKVLNAQVANGTAMINVNDAFSGIALQDQIVALAQLVYTATSLPDVNQVQITLNSGAVEVPRGDGTLTHDPLKPGDYPTFAPG